MAFNNDPYSPVITDVSLPFSNALPWELTADKQIQVQGIVQNDTDAMGFSVNLCKGPGIETGCALHFNPRFDKGCVVLNNFKDGGWDSEVRPEGMPFVKGQLFDIIIVATAADYKIAVNGKQFTEFKHRMPMKDVKYIYIAGDHMKINYVNFGDGNMGGNILHNPKVPLTEPVFGGMLPNRMIYISGVPLSGGQRFSINLEDGKKDVIFHFDVRLSFGDDQNVVLCNSCTDGDWGEEERNADNFPFMFDAPFDVIICATPNSFKVAVNNNHFIEYAHRQPLQRANTLKITGDVRITSVRFQ